MRFPITNVAGAGFTPDPADLVLPDGAWTDSRNVRFRDGAAEKFRGYQPALGDLSVTAIYAQPVTDGTNYFWVYGGPTVLYATDGEQHANISPASGSLGATEDLGYTGGVLNGFVVLTDGVNQPYSWAPALTNDCISLTAWPVGVTCKVIRPFRDFLFALRITSGGTLNPRLLRWSDAAAQGALPGSWDFTDPTNQAGITELGQTGDALVDAVPIRDELAIYKEAHTWVAQYIGGADVFAFRQVLTQSGLLTENCAVPFKGRHFAVTQDDIILFDGNDGQSIADGRVRRWLFGRINSNRYRRCFATADYLQREILFAFPESGFDWPNLALVWNWASNTFAARELGRLMTFGTVGIIPGQDVSFGSDSGTFDQAADAFDEATFNPSQTRVILLEAARRRAQQLGQGEDFDGLPMESYLTRTGMALSRDLGRRKRVKRIFPELTGSIGDTFEFYVSVRDSPGGASSETGPYTFTIGTDFCINCRVSGRVIDLRIEHVGSTGWKLSGMAIEFQEDGYR